MLINIYIFHLGKIVLDRELADMIEYCQSGIEEMTVFYGKRLIHIPLFVGTVFKVLAYTYKKLTPLQVCSQHY